ncbi:MAG TPA: hypothetical protein VH682_12160 [Gemmataceae bacterium]|jgi:hypothetical protein
MNEDGHDLVVRVHQRFREQNPPPPPTEPPTIHYTELPPSEPGSAIAEEWETYRREVGRLLAEGNEGRYILIKGRQIIGIWNTRKEAFAAADQRFPLQPFLVHQIQERERIHRIGYNRLCPS